MDLIGGSILVVMITIKLDTQVTIGVNEQKPFEVAKSMTIGSVHPHHHYHDHHRKGGSRRREKERQFPRGQRSSQAATLHYDPTVQLLYFSNCCSWKISWNILEHLGISCNIMIPQCSCSTFQIAAQGKYFRVSWNIL